MIVLTLTQWEILKEKLSKEHPLSVMTIRYKMREVLGFTVREHQQWIEAGKSVDGRPLGYLQTWICLDFYNDALEAWFQLKYM